MKSRPLFSLAPQEPPRLPDESYTGQFLRGTRVMIHIGKDSLYPGMVVRDFQADYPYSKGRRCVIDEGGHRWERFFDCDDLIARE